MYQSSPNFGGKNMFRKSTYSFYTIYLIIRNFIDGPNMQFHMYNFCYCVYEIFVIPSMEFVILFRVFCYSICGILLQVLIYILIYGASTKMIFSQEQT